MMTKRGGYRPGSGRKPSIETQIVESLREVITSEDFCLAVEVLRETMKQRRNIKARLSAAQFTIEHKIGKPPLPISTNVPSSINVRIHTVSDIK